MSNEQSPLEQAAQEARGNWQSFDCFVWHDQPEDPEDWAIVYTNNRDSGLLDQSNASAIEQALMPFMDSETPDVVAEHHGHWACGWVDGFAIRVYRGGEITTAFRKWFELMTSLADYPVLDDEDYSRREYEATLENIGNAAYSVKGDYELPDDWESEVFSWFWDSDQSAVENCDDQGGYPSEEQLRKAFDALGYPETVDA